MREILFRGMYIGDGEWVYGSLVTCEAGTFIFQERDIMKGLDVDGWLNGCRMIEVIPETVGQYVGLKDRDGMKIFEGDILESPVKRVDQSHGNLILIDDIRTCQFAALYVSEYKVIGNVHDNPELLEGTQYERSKIHAH